MEARSSKEDHLTNIGLTELIFVGIAIAVAYGLFRRFLRRRGSSSDERNANGGTVPTRHIDHK